MQLRLQQMRLPDFHMPPDPAPVLPRGTWLSWTDLGVVVEKKLNTRQRVLAAQKPPVSWAAPKAARPAGRGREGAEQVLSALLS